VNVLLVTSRYPPHTGGVETHVSEIAERLAARGHTVTVRSADGGGEGARREERAGVGVRRHRALAPGGAFHVAPGVLPAVRRSNADVVHVHNYHSLPFTFGALAATVPVVATPHYHGASASSLRDPLLRAFRPVGGAALRRAERVVAVSAWERDRLREDFGVEATVVPNGLDVERFRGATPLDREPYLLCVGRLERYKGVQHAIRALPDLGFDLVVAGDGPYRTDLEAVARQVGVAERVEFRGYVPDEDLPGLYAGAAAHLALSEFEAYGMTVAESLAAGTPCVVRTAGALREWADRADCVGVDDTDPISVVAGVKAVVGRDAPSDPLPTWENVTDRIEALYREVQT
jgi:glycosyltransferase involved in cell wall biosynthesis